MGVWGGGRGGGIDAIERPTPSQPDWTWEGWFYKFDKFPTHARKGLQYVMSSQHLHRLGGWRPAFPQTDPCLLIQCWGPASSLVHGAVL